MSAPDGPGRADRCPMAHENGRFPAGAASVGPRDRHEPSDLFPASRRLVSECISRCCIVDGRLGSLAWRAFAAHRPSCERMRRLEGDPGREQLRGGRGGSSPWLGFRAVSSFARAARRRRGHRRRRLRSRPGRRRLATACLHNVLFSSFRAVPTGATRPCRPSSISGSSVTCWLR